MSKYIDLIGQITERLDVPCGNIRLGICEALAYLDRHPEHVPGRTITEKLADDIREVDGGHNLGAGVLAERLASLGWTKAPGAGES